MLNTQAIEPFDGTTGGTLDLHSIWYTLQGEGPYTGTPAIFIRLAGCNLKCPWCDTEYTKGRKRVTVNQLVRRVLELSALHEHVRLIVLTGGEPTRQNIDPLIYELLALEYHVQIESNGVLAPTANFLRNVQDQRVAYIISPKTRLINHQALFATAFKYVLDANSIREEDGLPLQALGHTAKPYIARPPEGFGGAIYVNPMDADDPVANRANLLACRDSALKFGYIVGVQLHKILGVD